MLKLTPHPVCTQLSFQEERALPWLLDESGLSSNVNAAIAYDARIDEAWLRHCLEAAAARHEGVRTRFVPTGGTAFQRLVRPADIPNTTLSTRLLDAMPGDAAVDEALSGFCNRAFRASDEHWLRGLLLHLADGSSVFAISMPHIASDAVSMRLLIRGIWQDYAALARNRPLRATAPRWTLRDFVGSQRTWADTDDFRSKFDALAGQVVHGIGQMHASAPGHEHRALPPRHSVAIRHRFHPALSDALAALARDSRAGLFNVLMAGACLALARVFGQRQLCLRMPFSNRVVAGSDEIVGFLANDVPLFVNIDEGTHAAQFLRHVQQGSLSTMRFGAIPWSLLDTHLRTHPVMAGGNPFDVYLVNVFPPADDLLVDDDPEGRFRARFQPMPLTGFTRNVLKIWLHSVNGQIGLILRVGAEQEEVASQHWLPAFLDVFGRLARQPELALAHLLAARPA
ncbi:condensation domain-containing protein [Uliginosibacterium sp. H1]|uniref:condensation domain-containing protein n=1 Tax=Uliginosibacterium sp. H1 TaxID=3114757 RepID=UPI002E19CC03|nr:condensation domain-containing protein [Uliginosibacterium sp. H1]